MWCNQANSRYFHYTQAPCGSGRRVAEYCIRVYNPLLGRVCGGAPPYPPPQVVYLSPLPRTTPKRGILPGERDVSPGQWRVFRWAKQVCRH